MQPLSQSMLEAYYEKCTLAMNMNTNISKHTLKSIHTPSKGNSQDHEQQQNDTGTSMLQLIYIYITIGLINSTQILAIILSTHNQMHQHIPTYSGNILQLIGVKHFQKIE